MGWEKPDLMLGTLLAGGAAAISYIGVFFFRKWALGRQLVDLPNERSSHIQPTPRGGGLVMVLLSLAGLCLVASLSPMNSWRPIWGYLAGAVLVAGVSWVDDVRKVSYGLRLFVHALATTALLSGTQAFSQVMIPFAGNVPLGGFAIPLMALWILGLTNAYNFMDGIDGLAAGQAMIAAVGWIALGWVTKSPVLFGFSTILAGASLGFILHNWAPATVFMGDVGSAFLGYTFAALPLLTRALWDGLGDGVSHLPGYGVLFVWPFVFDTVFTFIRRLVRKEDVFSAHRSHLYQRLVIAGYRHSTVTLLYLLLASVGVLVGLARKPILMLAVPVLATGLWAYVRWAERREKVVSPTGPSS